MDIVDYYIQRAFVSYYSQSLNISADDGLSENDTDSLTDDQQKYNLVISHYLAECININRAAELLDIPWLDLRTRFLRIGIPLRSAPANIEEARAEIEEAGKWAGID